MILEDSKQETFLKYLETKKNVKRIFNILLLYLI